MLPRIRQSEANSSGPAEALSADSGRTINASHGPWADRHVSGRRLIRSFVALFRRLLFISCAWCVACVFFFVCCSGPRVFVRWLVCCARCVAFEQDYQHLYYGGLCSTMLCPPAGEEVLLEVGTHDTTLPGMLHAAAPAPHMYTPHGFIPSPPKALISSISRLVSQAYRLPFFFFSLRIFFFCLSLSLPSLFTLPVVARVSACFLLPPPPP